MRGYGWSAAFLPHLDEISPIEAIAGIPSSVPVLILAGEADPLARPEEARALLDRVAGHGDLHIFPVRAITTYLRQPVKIIRNCSWLSAIR